MLMFTGHPSIQEGLGQSRQRLASVRAISLVRPMFTSSVRVVARYTGSSSGIFTRSMAVRSLGFIEARSALRHSASRLVSSVTLSLVGSTSIVTSVLSFFLAASTVARCSSKCSISSRSTSLKVPMRLNISSQSTRAPSNSGPSMQTNLVLPPMVSRQAPHIPVPSTMMVLSDTSVGRLYFCVSRQQNFIMIGGPMAKALSMCSCWMSFSIPTVTTPFSP